MKDKWLNIKVWILRELQVYNLIPKIWYKSEIEWAKKEANIMYYWLHKK